VISIIIIYARAHTYTHTHTHTNVYKLTSCNRGNRVAYSRFIGILQLSFV